MHAAVDTSIFGFRSHFGHSGARQYSFGVFLSLLSSVVGPCVGRGHTQGRGEMLTITNPTTASLPQGELGALTRPQLMQSATILHAGWTAATKRLNEAELHRTLDERERVERDAAVDLELQESRSRIHQLETQLREKEAHLCEAERRAARAMAAVDSGSREGGSGDASFELLRHELVDAKAEILSLSRRLRLKVPLDYSQLQGTVEILERQRALDRDTIQTQTVDIARLHQELLGLQAEVLHARRDRDAPVSTTAPGGGPSLSQGQSPTMAGRRGSRGLTMPGSGFGSAGGGGGPTGAAFTVSVGIQTDSGLLKTLDLLQKAHDQIAQLQRTEAAHMVELSAVEHKVSEAQSTLAVATAVNARKDKLIAELVRRLEAARANSDSPAAKRQAGDESSSLLDAGDDVGFAASLVAYGDALSGYSGLGEDDVRFPLGGGDERPSALDTYSTTSIASMLETKRRLQRVEKELETVTKTLEARDAALAEAKAEVERYTRSISQVAEDNAILSFQVQQISGMASSELSELVSAHEQLQIVQASLNLEQANSVKLQATIEQLDELLRANGNLQGRIEKYQLEVATFSTENKHLRQELGEAAAVIADLTNRSRATATADWEGVDDAHLDAASRLGRGLISPAISFRYAPNSFS